MAPRSKEELEQRLDEVEQDNARLRQQSERRERLIQELIGSRTMLDRITSGMVDGLMVIDRRYRIHDVNEGFLLQYGGSREDNVGRTCHEVTHREAEPCEGDSHCCPARAVFESGESARVEHLHRNQQGEEIVVEVHAFPLPDEGGEVEFVVEVSRDVTEVRRATQERAERERLEGVVEMAGAVCHELNQPTQVMLVNTDRALRSLSANDENRELLQAIRTSIDRIRAVTRKLQHITRYETKSYVGAQRIIDIDRAAGVVGTPSTMPPSSPGGSAPPTSSA